MSGLITSRLAGLLVGLVVAAAVVAVWTPGSQTDFQDLAILEGTSYYAESDGFRIHCTGLGDLDRCLSGVRRAHDASVVLWLGNSQLHAINQYRPGDRNAPPLLHDRLRSRGEYLLTLSQPNANLQEHLALFAYLLPRLKPVKLLLPVVFDDFRENGVRADIAMALNDEQAAALLRRSVIGRQLVDAAGVTGASEDDFAGIRETLQERSELWLTRWLDAHSDTWANRGETRAQVFLLLYQLRNWMFGVKATSARRVIPANFAANWSALIAILDLAKESHVTVYAYVAPTRNDVTPPYEPSEYAAFRERLKREVGSRAGLVLGDLERAVPNQYWGTKPATTLGGEAEYDFMHFRSDGHQAFAQAVAEFLDREPERLP